MTLALEGIRILDITDAVSGPFAGMMLGSFGAEVIRIESQRHLGFRDNSNNVKMTPDATQHAKAAPNPAKPDLTALTTPGFARYNLDKLSITLNLTKPEGREVFKKLVKISDVVLDNLSFGIMHQWGFDYPGLSRIKNDIIVAGLPSFGKGPHEKWTTWGMNLLCFTGFAYTWGHPETPMEERAASSTYGDYIAGMMAVSSIITALYHREKTGAGQYLEVSQTEAAASLLGVQDLDYFVNGRVPQPVGNRNPQYAPYNCYPCKGEDRWCVITVFNEADWQHLCTALESPKWASEPKFATMESRLKNAAELDKNIEGWTRQKTPHQVMRILQSAGVAAGAVQNSEDLFFDLQLRDRGHMVELEAGLRGKLTFDQPPIRLTAGQKPSTERAPFLGEHNDYIYHQLLGLTPEQVEKFTLDKVIY